MRTVDSLALWLGRLVLAFVAWIVVMQTLLRLLRRYVHFPAPPFISVFLDSPLRRAMQSPEEVIARVGIESGQTVLELGCGPGTFTVEAARRTLPGGRLLAVDVEPQMLARLRKKVARAGVENVEIYQADAYSLPAGDASVDVAFMVGVLAEIPDRQRALAELRRVLKPGGVLSVSELLVDPDYPRRRTVARWCERAGFHLESGHGGLLEYTLNFRKL